MADMFRLHDTKLSDPASNAQAVTPNDGVDLAQVSRALYVGTGGTLSVVTLGGQTVSLTVHDGAVIPLRCTRVRATGTTATGIVNFY